MEGAPPYIWLKQSVQFTVGQQTRTIEVGIPIRPGATREEIEQLLQQADAGMEQLSTHIQAWVRAALRSSAPAVSGQAAAMPSAERHRTAGPMGPSGEGSQRVSPPRDQQQPAAPASNTFPSRGTPGEPATVPPSAGTGSALGRKQFIAEIAVLGLNPRQAMERLGVRSLDGLNLGEALEQLRHQLLRDRNNVSSPPGAAGDAQAGTGRTGPAAPRASVSRGPTGLSRSARMDQASGAEQGSVADVPLLEVRPEVARYFEEEEAPEHPREAPIGRHAPHVVAERAAAPESAHPVLASMEMVRAKNQLNKLREIRGSPTAPSAHQLRAFTNIVVGQLQPGPTRALLQRIWRVSAPDKLTSEQIQALIEWGRQDEFEQEAQRVLAVSEP